MEIEITPDVLSINGILVNAKAKFGDLSKIIHKGFGGNEEKITYVIESLKSFLLSKNYMDDNLPKRENDNYFKDLCLLLIVNTEFSKPFNIEEYAHLTYNVPKISKYVLSRLILNLNLVEYFCPAVERLPFLYSCELFSEFSSCLDKVQIHQLSRDTYFILKSIGNILLDNQDSKYCDEMDTLLRPVPEFFFKFSRISEEKLQKLKKTIIYEHAGNVVQKLFRLLLFCDKNNLYGIFMDKLLEATTNVVRGVSLDMFIYWAEIDLDSGQTLQNEIAEQAYVIIAKYQQFKPASEVVQSLKPFASKPKDIKEQINMADLEKIVFMVNKADENQKQWFEALVFSPFLSNKKAIECVSKWGHLCQEEDVSRLLNECLKVNDEDGKNLALKCASLLDLQQLTVIVTRHFYNNGAVVLNDDVQGEIVLLFNMLKDSDSVNESITVKLLLLILQNPESVISFILTECISNVFYVTVLKGCFTTLKDILKIHDICVNCLQKTMKSVPPTAKNFENYAKLLQTILDIGISSNEVLIMKIVNSYIAENTDLQELQALLKILNVLNISVQVKEITSPFIEKLFKLLQKRTKFMNFSSTSQDVVREVVKIITNKTHRNVETGLPILNEDAEDDKYTSYYKTWLRNSEKKFTLLFHLISDFCVENHTTAVCRLMQVNSSLTARDIFSGCDDELVNNYVEELVIATLKMFLAVRDETLTTPNKPILPSCVTEEWNLICSEILQMSSFRNLVKLLSHMTIMLCQFTQSQEDKENYSTLIQSLKYCINHLGIVIKNIMSTNNNLEDEVVVSDSLVELMCHFPLPVKETEGLTLLSLMTEQSLKTLNEDKTFVGRICRIRDVKICQVLAQRILS